MKTDYYVYGLIDPRTRLPFYIGKGREFRAERHLYSSTKHNKFTQNVIDKIKSSGLTIDIIKFSSNISEEQSLFLEQMLISIYGRRINNSGILTNASTGGESGTSGVIRSVEFKERASRQMKGKRVGENNPNYGKKLDRELVERRLSKRRETNRIGSRTNRDDLSRKIIQIDSEGKHIKVWESAREASRQLGINHPYMTRNANYFPNRKAGGYHWQWAE